MNADSRQAGALIHRVDALDLPHIDQMGHVPAYDNSEVNGNWQMKTWRNISAQ